MNTDNAVQSGGTVRAIEVARYVVKHPYHGRDEGLAQGWLVAIAAARRGEDVEAALQKFCDEDFMVGNNNGIPGWRRSAQTGRTVR